MSDFWECETCESKPGAPMLCVGCLHNRHLIDDLRAKLLSECKMHEETLAKLAAAEKQRRDWFEISCEDEEAMLEARAERDDLRAKLAEAEARNTQEYGWNVASAKARYDEACRAAHFFRKLADRLGKALEEHECSDSDGCHYGGYEGRPLETCDRPAALADWQKARGQ